VLEAFDAARYAQPITHAQFISLSFEKAFGYALGIGAVPEGIRL